MKLEAGRTGRYAWARCGFNFWNPSDDRPRVPGAAQDLAAALGVPFEPGRIEHPWQLAALALWRQENRVFDPGCWAPEIPVAR